jgi:hypothetical protein
MDPTPPAMCVVCRAVRVAWTTPRVDFCYDCLPGGPLTPPPCSGCGSGRYFNNGLCVACHPRGPEHIESCLGCLAWGVTRKYRSRCWTCRWWKTHYVEGDCVCCNRRTILSERRACRLCWEQARLRQQSGRAVDLAEATRCGQQLFFANVQSSRQAPRRRLEPPRGARASRPGGGQHKRPLRRLSQVASGQRFNPVPWTQLALFEPELDPAVVTALAASADGDLLRYCDEVVRDHAAAHGWSRKQTNDVRRSLRLVEVLQHTPNAKICASDVLKLPSLQGNVSAQSTLDVLAAAGLLIDDRTSPVERYFIAQVDGLPAAMTTQLRTWFEIMINGSPTTPRRHPRDPQTARLQIYAMAPILRRWAAQGHDSLVAIGRDDIVAALPARGARRHLVEQALRSLFRVLKARKLIFHDPIRGLPVTDTNSTLPLPLDTETIRAALNSPHPARALAVALVAFHALTSRQLRGLQLTDIVDGRLSIEGRVIPLAAPVLSRLAAWLDHRATTWPKTINPHLFINRRTGPRRTPVSRSFPWSQIKLAPQTLREDRILDEVRATGGDIRRICELFHLSVEGALRYTATLDHIDDEATTASARTSQTGLIGTPRRL